MAGNETFPYTPRLLAVQLYELVLRNLGQLSHGFNIEIFSDVVTKLPSKVANFPDRDGGEQLRDRAVGNNGQFVRFMESSGKLRYDLK